MKFPNEQRNKRETSEGKEEWKKKKVTDPVGTSRLRNKHPTGTNRSAGGKNQIATAPRRYSSPRRFHCPPLSLLHALPVSWSNTTPKNPQRTLKESSKNPQRILKESHGLVDNRGRFLHIITINQMKWDELAGEETFAKRAETSLTRNRTSVISLPSLSFIFSLRLFSLFLSTQRTINERFKRR